MPFSSMRQPNSAPFEAQGIPLGSEDSLRSEEVALQISPKFPLVNDLLVENDGLQIGFTTISFWQACSGSVSAPFRETNYEPEIFWGHH